MWDLEGNSDKATIAFRRHLWLDGVTDRPRGDQDGSSSSLLCVQYVLLLVLQANQQWSQAQHQMHLQVHRRRSYPEATALNSFL